MNRALRSALPAGLKPFLPKCASANCRPHSRFFSLSFRPGGISIDNDWFCGPDCFQEATEHHLAQLCAGRKFGVDAHRPRLPLGLSLLSLGHITSESLQLSLEYQRQNGGRIGDVLIALGLANQAQIASALSAQWGYPVLSLRNRQLQAPQRIPVRLMKRYSMLPIHFVAKTNKLVVGFAEFVEHRILSTIETMYKCTVVPCFITHDEFESHLQAVELQLCNEEVVFEQRASIQEIAHITRSYACQIGAMSASFGMCCDYVWSRLQGSRTTVDLLSRS